MGLPISVACMCSQLNSLGKTNSMAVIPFTAKNFPLTANNPHMVSQTVPSRPRKFPSRPIFPSRPSFPITAKHQIFICFRVGCPSFQPSSCSPDLTSPLFSYHLILAGLPYPVRRSPRVSQNLSHLRMRTSLLRTLTSRHQIPTTMRTLTSLHQIPTTLHR